MGGRHGIKPVNRTSELSGLNASVVPISGGRLRGSYVKRVGVAPPTGRAGIPANFWRRGVLCLLYNELTKGHVGLSRGVVMIRYSQWPEQKSLGGQHVGTGPSGVKGVHYLTDTDGSEYPTGIQACCGAERSQFKNRLAVEQMIEWACAATRTPFE